MDASSACHGTKHLQIKQYVPKERYIILPMVNLARPYVESVAFAVEAYGI